MEFFLPMAKLPSATAQQKGMNRQTGAWYDPENVKAARAKFMAHLGQHRPAQPIEGPVRLVVKWCYPASAKHPVGTWNTTKPDTDNMIKLFKDCMTRCCFWLDDAQVCSEINEKFYNDVPGIFVRVEELSNSQKG